MYTGDLLSLASIWISVNMTPAFVHETFSLKPNWCLLLFGFKAVLVWGTISFSTSLPIMELTVIRR